MRASATSGSSCNCAETSSTSSTIPLLARRTAHCRPAYSALAPTRPHPSARSNSALGSCSNKPSDLLFLNVAVTAPSVGRLNPTQSLAAEPLRVLADVVQPPKGYQRQELR